MKNFVLDTNVLLHDPNSLLNFQDNRVLIPIEVIEEIDRFKREATELGQNARAVSRMLDGFRVQGHLNEGVKLPNGGHLRVVFRKRTTRNGNGNGRAKEPTVDDRILSLCLGIQKQEPKRRTILITKDINLRIKADALGLPAEDYETDRVFITDLYTGMIELMLSPEAIARFRAAGELALPADRPYAPNEYCTLMDETHPKRAVLTKVTPPPRGSFPFSTAAAGCGASARATASSISPSTRCSMTASNWSHSWARPARAKRCWPWPPA